MTEVVLEGPQRKRPRMSPSTSFEKEPDDDDSDFFKELNEVTRRANRGGGSLCSISAAVPQVELHSSSSSSSNVAASSLLGTAGDSSTSSSQQCFSVNPCSSTAPPVPPARLAQSTATNSYTGASVLQELLQTGQSPSSSFLTATTAISVSRPSLAKTTAPPPPVEQTPYGYGGGSFVQQQRPHLSPASFQHTISAIPISCGPTMAVRAPASLPQYRPVRETTPSVIRAPNEYVTVTRTAGTGNYQMVNNTAQQMTCLTYDGTLAGQVNNTSRSSSVKPMVALAPPRLPPQYPPYFQQQHQQFSVRPHVVSMKTAVSSSQYERSRPNMPVVTSMDGAYKATGQNGDQAPIMPTPQSNYNSSFPLLPSTSANDKVPPLQCRANLNQVNQSVAVGNGEPVPSQTASEDGCYPAYPQSAAVPPQSVNQHESEKRKLIQQQLILLLHAHKCQQRDRQLGQSGGPLCTLPHCPTMKNVLTHMMGCSLGRTCQYQHCASSRQIINHWKNCDRLDCPVCSPLKSMHREAGQRHGGAAGPVVAPALPATDGSVRGCPNGPPNVTPPFPSPLQPPSNNSQSEQLVSPPPAPLIGGPLIEHQQQGEKLELPPPPAPETPQSWHSGVTSELRSHLVRKLVDAIYPVAKLAVLMDQRIKDLIQYATRVEKSMFEQATTREEYYHLLAEKIYKIQKELQEKKQNRQMMEQQQFIEQQGGQQAGKPSARFDLSFQLSILDSQAPPNRALPPPVDYSQQSHFQLPQDKDVKQELDDDACCSKTEHEPSRSGVKNSSQHESCGGGGLFDMKPKLEVPSPSAANKPADSASDGLGVGRSSESTTLSSSLAKKAKKNLPTREKKFSREELLSSLLPVWETIYLLEEAVPFHVPVDPVLLKIPDYFTIIKHPMDMRTIRQKLDSWLYNDPLAFLSDFYLMFDNAKLYNRKNSKVHKLCLKVEEVFEELIDAPMQSLGYCCGQRLAFTPLPFVCYGTTASCVIQRDQTFFYYEHRISTSVSDTDCYTEKYTYCAKCFENLPAVGINLSDDTNAPNWISKEKFSQAKNDQLEYEKYEACQVCMRKWHMICALHNDKVYSDGFVCFPCRRDFPTRRLPENRFTAKLLPHCHLSRHIECRVNGYLKRKLAEDAGEVYVRVLSSSEREVEVKPNMAKRYASEGYPTKFPYRSKAIFAFEVIDGCEVCFFGLHVQEYGSNAAKPNQRRVYIAYLDSVHFFKPRTERTNVYHEILLGYLEYVRKLGYTMAHIWACPPQEGDDYIFHCHPLEQRIPKQKRLQEWYKKMLDKGVIERTVLDYKDIYSQAQADKLQTLTALPYFEGDFWPTVFEDIIRDAEKAEKQRREQELEAQSQESMDDAVAVDELPDDDLYDSGVSGLESNFLTKKAKKRNAKNKNSKNRKKATASSGNELTDKLFTHLEKHKEVFFTIRLLSAHASNSLGVIRDPDPLISGDLMDGRDTLLAKSRDEHWEFSTLRRAKYSTVCLVQALHAQWAPAGDDEAASSAVYCDRCRGPADLHCTSCQESYDLCKKCYSQHSHEHPMVDAAAGSKVDRANRARLAQDHSSRAENLKRAIQALVHSCECRDANCRQNCCQKMKLIVEHHNKCSRRHGGGCSACKQLLLLCLHHAKHCASNTCLVPYCINIQMKLRQQKQAQRRQNDLLMRRRMNAMSSQPAPDVPLPPVELAAGTAQPPLTAYNEHRKHFYDSPVPPVQPSASTSSYQCSQSAIRPLQAGGMGSQVVPPSYGQQQRPRAWEAAGGWHAPSAAAGVPVVHHERQLDQLMEQFRRARTKEEQDRIWALLKTSPPLLSKFMERANCQQQSAAAPAPPQLLQQKQHVGQGWSSGGGASWRHQMASAAPMGVVNAQRQPGFVGAASSAGMFAPPRLSQQAIPQFAGPPPSQSPQQQCNQ